ncbi:MAG: type III pantothenate kinase [Gammaproteobacteria bacterium]|nr:type III pantothenate kinase [Gammaproteobacteria bacterium]
MTVLLIDAGNSSLKWALCRNGSLETGDPVVYRRSSLVGQLTETWQFFAKENISLSRIILSNVAGQQVFDALCQWRDKALVVKEAGDVSIEVVVAQTSAYGVINAYKQPEALGADRWAGLVAARHYVKGNACIVSCGSALTVDILTADGVHVGGIIAPGWEMMESSLVANTKGITSGDSEVPELLGQTTQQAVQAGISAASVGAVKYIVQRYQEKMGIVLTCVITGGAAPLLLPKLLSLEPASNFLHEPVWVLKGLAIISGNPVDEDLPSSPGGLS